MRATPTPVGVECGCGFELPKCRITFPIKKVGEGKVGGYDLLQREWKKVCEGGGLVRFTRKMMQTGR